MDNNKMGKLDIIIGPMFAGKSTYLVKSINETIEAIGENSVLVIKHKSDNRYEEDNTKSNIITHDKTSYPCLSVNNLSEIIKLYDEKLNTTIEKIFIDEAQFFDDLYDIVIYLVEYKKIDVLIVGLDGDFERRTFGKGDILKLIPFADSVQKLNSRCYICNKPAPFTKRIVKSQEQVIVGGADIYQPACRIHFSKE